NSRLDELQAAILRVLLPELDGWCAARRALGDAYAESGLAEDVGIPEKLQHSDPAWHLYVITHPDAARLQAALGERGIQARGYYRTPIHRQPAMAPLAANTVSLPATDELARTNLALPMSPAFGQEQAQRVVEAIKAV